MFNVKKISGLSGGSGIAPGIYAYETDDSIADVTTNGYWDELGGTLQIGDLIYAVLLAGSAPTLQRLVVNLSTVVDSKTALMDAFVGDVRADDEAGYQSTNFSGNIGAGSNQRLFSYRNNANTLVEIAAPGYFNELSPVLTVGDLIYTVASNGASYLRVVDNTDGVVSTVPIGFAP